MSNIELSIIVLTYNQEQYISYTLDSILNQNIQTSYEVIIGDDASSDTTQDIILKYYKQYPDIIKPVLRNKNIGVIHNYFDLISLCSGELIMECAGDDYWAPGKVEKQIDFMKKNKECPMCCGNVIIVNENGKAIGSSELSPKKLCRDELFKVNSIYALTACFRSECIKDYMTKNGNILFEWKMEDYPFWLWISEFNNIGFMPDVLGYYRINEQSITHCDLLSKRIEFEECAYNIRCYFAKNKREKNISDKTYYKNISHIYLTYGNIFNFIRFALKSKDMGYLLFVPIKMLFYLFK